MPKSMMSSPRARAAALSSPVMLNTYGGRRFSRQEFLHWPGSYGATEYAHIDSPRRPVHLLSRQCGLAPRVSSVMSMTVSPKLTP